MIYALILFVITYILMLVFSKYRTYIALGSALVFIVSGMLPLDQIVPSIDFNVLLMIAGTMGSCSLTVKCPPCSLIWLWQRCPMCRLRRWRWHCLQVSFLHLLTMWQQC